MPCEWAAVLISFVMLELISHLLIQIAGEIPYDPAVTKAQIAGQTIVEYSNGHLKDQIVFLWKSVLKAL